MWPVEGSFDPITADLKLTNGVAKSLRCVGKGNRKRLVPLPEAFEQVFGFWLTDRPRDDLVFAQRHRARRPRSADLSLLRARHTDYVLLFSVNVSRRR
jgi:site-specific recombinase XerD